MGLMELMLNAIEHGNLGITYDEKTALIREDCLQEEVQRRLELPENADKFASIKFRRDGISLIFVISDQGNGFDWKSYLEMGMERLMDNHGRGIAMSRSISFTQLEYRGKGNIVEATIIRH
jgi:anti-sigma regulatory factor (Ser/Thr protein kinase)